MIILKNLYKVYYTSSETFTALSNINLTIRKKEFVSIMGRSGSGKSTLMNILGILDNDKQGDYVLNRKKIADLSDESAATIRNKKIGFVFQSFNLMPRMSLLDNVALPLLYNNITSKERKKMAKIALEKVGLSHRLSHKPSEISGGQKQRVAIARAIINNPSILLADEPTGNLDSKTTKEIMKIFQDLNEQGTTIVMVTHEPEVAQYSKRIISLLDGEIASDQLLLKKRKRKT